MANISFSQIPTNLRVPGTYVEIDANAEVSGLSVLPTRILVLGQMLASGTATPLAPVLVTSAAQAVGLFGRGSMLARMLAALFTANNYTETWACPTLDLAAGTAATGSLTVTAAPTVNGTLYLYIGGQQVPVAVSAGQTVAQVAAAIAAQIQAQPDLALTAATPTTATVTVTAQHKGLCGNSLDMRLSYYNEAIPAGLALTLTALSGGTGQPAVAPIVAALGEVWWTDWVTPWTDSASLAALETALTADFGPLLQHDSHCWGVVTGSVATLQTLGLATNYNHLTLMASQNSPTPPWEYAAALAGVAAYYLGIDPGRPLQTLALPGVLAPAITDRFLFAQRQTLLWSGIATSIVNPGGTVQIERAITTYTTAPSGAADASYLDVETLRVLAYLRYDLRTLIQLKYPRAKLAADGTVIGQSANTVATANANAGATATVVVTPKVMRAEMLARFNLWLAAGLVQNQAAFAAGLTCQINAADPNRLDVWLPVQVIGQLRVEAFAIAFWK